MVDLPPLLVPEVAPCWRVEELWVTSWVFAVEDFSLSRSLAVEISML